MKKIINGTLCNTETAKLLGTYEHHREPDQHWYRERLYKTKSGRYFLRGIGNWASPYATPTGNGGYMDGEKIKLFASGEAARQWAEEHLTADEYMAAYGEPEEGEEILKVAISAQARAKLDSERDRTGETLGEIVNRVLSGNL